MAEVLSSLASKIHEARHRLMTGHAASALEELTKIADPFATLSIVKGECLYVMGRFKEATAEFADALRRSPNSPRTEIMLELATDMAELNRTLIPAVTIESLVGVTSESIEFPLTSKPIEEKAAPMAIPEVALTDEIGLVSETLADLMIQQGKYDDARKVFIQLSRLNPDRYSYFRERITQLDQRS